MTTEATLIANREQQDQQRRAQDRDHARLVLAASATRHHLTPAETRDLLAMCGLLGDPVDDGTPVVLPHPFDQPAAVLSAPASGTYR